MRVEDKQSLEGAGAAAAQPVAARKVARAPADKVSLQEAKQVETAVLAVRTKVGVDRGARLQELKGAIRQGDYRPDAGRLAEKIVQSAEVDARLSVLFGG
jgi:anti-sigma28 factor (negative regulator of flagellin synthesis)